MGFARQSRPYHDAGPLPSGTCDAAPLQSLSEAQQVPLESLAGSHLGGFLVCLQHRWHLLKPESLLMGARRALCSGCCLGTPHRGLTATPSPVLALPMPHYINHSVSRAPVWGHVATQLLAKCSWPVWHARQKKGTWPFGKRGLHCTTSVLVGRRL